MKLAAYRSSDKTEIQQLYVEAFSHAENPSEGALIGNLVLDMIDNTHPRDIYGFVAIEHEKIVGCIFFTRLSFESSIDAFILSPVAIQTRCQGEGIGQALINFGIRRLKSDGVNLAFTYGDPAFYSKVGFERITEDVANAPVKMSQPEGWLCQALDGGGIRSIPGRSRCVDALNKAEYW